MNQSIWVKLPNVFVLLLVFCVYESACQNKTFTGTGRSKAVNVTPTAPEPCGGPNNPCPPEKKTTGCVNGDMVKIQFPADIQSCLDQKRIWDFDNNVCTQAMTSSYECSFDAFAQNVRDLFIKGSDPAKAERNAGQVLAAKSAGSMLVACGEVIKDGSKILIAQWVSNPQGTFDAQCRPTAGMPSITTACFRLYPSNVAIPSGGTLSQCISY